MESFNFCKKASKEQIKKIIIFLIVSFVAIFPCLIFTILFLEMKSIIGMLFYFFTMLAFGLFLVNLIELSRQSATFSFENEIFFYRRLFCKTLSVNIKNIYQVDFLSYRTGRNLCHKAIFYNDKKAKLLSVFDFGSFGFFEDSDYLFNLLKFYNIHIIFKDSTY